MATPRQHDRLADRRTAPAGQPSIDIIWVALDRDAETCARLAKMLSPAEQRRAQAYRSARDRARYVVRHGRLRQWLGCRLGCPPNEVPISTNAFGKPFVAGTDIRFNLSHSHGLALCVIARGSEVGCDIEWQDRRLATPAVAERFYSPLEYRTLRSLSKSQWTEGFFNCWTRKEAFVKARGIGLSMPLDKFDVSLVPNAPAAILRGGEGWGIWTLRPCEWLHGAIAAEMPRAPESSG